MDNCLGKLPLPEIQSRSQMKKASLVEFKALVRSCFKDPFCLPSHCTKKVTLLQIPEGIATGEVET